MASANTWQSGSAKGVISKRGVDATRRIPSANPFCERNLITLIVGSYVSIDVED